MAHSDGRGDPRLIAYAAGAVQQPELAEAARARLPHYMRPSGYVILDAFPLNTNGKIARHLLPRPEDENLVRPRPIAPPRTDRERKLVDIWRSLLETGSIGVKDSFFDVGGSSLKAVSLMIAIEETFGKTLPLDVLLTEPTIEQLAALLGPEDPVRPSVVLLRAGGPEPPLFFVHDGVGQVLLYRNLALLLKGDRPIYGLEPLSRDGCPIVHTRLSEMADHYASEIRRIQPDGPYFLGGLCTGGLIAIEVAQRLQSAGQSMGLVALIDTPHNRARKKSVARKRLRAFSDALVEGLGERRSMRMFRILGQLTEGISNVLTYEIRRVSAEARKTFRVKLLRYFLDRGQALPPLVQNIPVREVLWIAEREFIAPALYRGKVVLFRATQQTRAINGTVVGGVAIDDTPYVERLLEPAFGWENRITTLTVHDVPGGHSSMLMDPNVKALAETLQGHLDAASGRNGETTAPSDRRHHDQRVA